jgi:hypothetical protein
MPNNKQLYQVIVSSPIYQTVSDYLNDINSPAYQYTEMPETFLKIIGTDGLTNRQRIEQGYKDFEDKKYIGAPATGLKLRVGTIFYLEYEKVNYQSFLTKGLEVVSYDVAAFKSAQLSKLEADKGYVSINKILPGQFEAGSSKDVFPDASVWMWCRSLSSKEDESEELQGQFLDLSPFIQKATTNIGRNGGNWSITLPPLICELDQDRKWVIRKKTINQFDNPNGFYTPEYVAEGSMFEFDTNGDALRRNQFYFNNAIRSNDLIFIRFETLKLEKEQRYQDAQNFYIDKSNIPNRIYDMIGLVDSVSMSTNAASNDVTINVSGRDLSKLLIEDGVFFYPNELKAGQIHQIGQSTIKNNLLSRIYGDGALSFLSLYMHTSIEYILKFVLDQLSNIKIVPDNLFAAYGDKRNNRYNVIEKYTNEQNPDFNYKKPVTKELASGIWQIFKLVLDQNILGRLIQDTSFSTAQGSLINFINTACQQPLIEMYMDTWGDMYHLIVRKPPYDQKALISLIEGKVNTEEGIPDTPPAIIDIEEDDVLQESLAMEEACYSWYSFFPRACFFGDSTSLELNYLGALYFPEYAEVWGSKAFQQTHPYLPYVGNSNSTEDLWAYELQAVQDLKYVIECNQYLPFTRKGTLVLNGDRRIKIGNVIRYKPTGEIFFVESVQQNIQINENAIDRTTTVQVSRGLIEQFIYGIHLAPEEGNGNVFVSYFNLIDTRLNVKEKKVSIPITVKKKVGTKEVSREKFSLQNNNSSNTEQGSFIIKPELVKGISYLSAYNQFPETKAVFIKFINAINQQGYSVTITSSVRDTAKQARLKQLNKHAATPGKSKHEIGRAIDINITNPKTGKRYYSGSSEEAWRSTGVPQIANSLGLRWAGNNDGTFGTKGTPGYWADRVHFEVIGNANSETITEDVYEEITEMKTVNGVDRDAIFENFKVNKFTFNFFLKNLQFDPEFKQVKSRTLYNSDQAGTPVDGSKFGDEKTLQNVIIRSTKKK